MPSSSIGTAHVCRLARVEGDQPAEERRVLGDDHVARVDQQLGNEVETLLPAVQDQDLVLAQVTPSLAMRPAI